MLKTRGRKIFRDILSNKLRTTMVAISIFVGVLGVVTLTSVGDMMVSKFNEDIREENLPMMVIGTDLQGDDPQFDETLSVLGEHLGLTVVEARTNHLMNWKKPTDPSFTEAQLRAYYKGFEDIQLQPMQLIEGEYPVTGQNQIAIERRMAERYELSVDDTIIIPVFGLDDESLRGTEQTWTISGIVFHPYVGSNGETAVYTTYEDGQTITDFDGFSAVSMRFENYRIAQDEFEDFQTRINERTPYDVTFTFIEDPTHNEFVEETQQWTNTLTILAIIAMIVSSFLVVTVINTIVVEQRRQIGSMKAIGATQWDNFSIYAGIALVYGIIGTIPGVLLGIPAAFELTKAVAPLAGLYVDDFLYSPLGIIIGIVLGLAVPVIASIVPVYMGTRVTILDALNDFGISRKFGGGPLARLIGWLPLPINIRQALANISQKKMRLALTGFTLTAAVGAFMGVSAVFLSLNDEIDNIFDTFNVHLGFRPQELQDFEATTQLIEENIDGIAVIHPIYGAGVEILRENASDPDDNTTNLFITGIDTHSDVINFDLTEGEGWQNDPDRSGIILTQPIADELGKDVGDTLTIIRDGRPHELELIGIDAFPFEEGFMQWEALSTLVGDQPDGPTPTGYWIRLDDDDPTVQQADRVIGEIRELLIDNGISADFFNQVANEEENAETVLTIGLVFNIASLVMATIGAIGLLVTLSISVFERQREIGVMRSIGASSSTIASQFLVEGMLVGIIAWCIGVPLSYGISQLLTNALPLEEFEIGFPIISLGLGLVGMIVIAAIASIWPSLSAVRKTVSDILRYQ